MCGLVSVINKNSNGLTKDQVDSFDLMLFLDQLRGKDSTGTFVVEKNGAMSLAKEASHATDFRTRKEYKDLCTLAFQRGSAMVGHNRAATKGSIIDVNAHPFVVDDNITLVHNGTLWGNHKDLADTEVDSHAIAHVIHENDGNLEKALQSINGAMALIWHDFKNQTLNFIRNSQRPLYCVETYNSWMWASEEGFLDFVLKRFKISTTSAITLLPEGVLSKFSLDNGKFTNEVTKLTITKPYVPVTYQPSKYTGPSYHNPCGDEDCWGDYPFVGRVDVPTITPPLTPPPRENSVMELIKINEENIAAKMGSFFTYDMYAKLTKDFKEGDWTTIQCVDYVEVHPTNPSLGYFLYGITEQDPDVIVKVHMPAATPDIKLMDWTMNTRRCSVKLKAKSWVLHRQPENVTGFKEGYTMFIGAEIYELLDPVKQEEIIHV